MHSITNLFLSAHLRNGWLQVDWTFFFVSCCLQLWLFCFVWKRKESGGEHRDKELQEAPHTKFVSPEPELLCGLSTCSSRLRRLLIFNCYLVWFSPTYQTANCGRFMPCAGVPSGDRPVFVQLDSSQPSSHQGSGWYVICTGLVSG